MKRVLSGITAAALVAALATCDSSDFSTNPDPELEGPAGAWQLEWIRLLDGRIVPVPDPSKYVLELSDAEAGHAHIQADCNVCNGNYEVSGSKLMFGVMGCTLAECGPDSFEETYRSALGATSTYVRDRDTLTLVYDGGWMRFRGR